MSQSYQACKSRCIFHSLTSHQTVTIYDYDNTNFIVFVLNWAMKIKLKETDYTVNYCIYYTNERGKPKRGYHKPALKCFYSFYFCQERKVRYYYCTEKYIYAHNLLTVTVLIWAKAVKSEMVQVQRRFKDL